MTLGVVVLAHRQPEQLALLLSLLDHAAIRPYLHLDARVPDEPFRRAMEARGVDGVRWLPRRATPWGGPEVVDASLDGIRAAREDGCDYLIQVSGQDLPVWPAGRIVAFFEANAPRSFVENFPLPDDRWRLGGRLRTERYTFDVGGRRETHLPPELTGSLSGKGRILNLMLAFKALPLGPRRFPAYARPHGGSQWWNLSADAADFILEFLREHPGYRRYHEHTLIPDELFFQSILAGTSFAEEHPVEDASLRHMVWEPDASHPRILGIRDLPALREADVPFARKFDRGTDAEVVRAVAEELAR